MITTKKIVPVAISIALGIAIGVFVANVAPPLFSGDGVREQVNKFQSVLENANRYYVDDVQPNKLTEAAIKGMLTELDPHSVYIPASQKKREDEDFRGSFEGIGVSFDILQDTITVVAPIVGGPSERLGIRSGDKIVKIDGQSSVAISDSAVMARLKGAKGTRVNVSIKRGGMKDLLDFTITRDKIPIYSVDASFLVPSTDIGYISVNRFAATTFDEFVKAARNLRNQGMKKMILDLRRNPGGYLEQAYEMADAFIPGGQKIVFTKGRHAQFNEDYPATSGGEFENIPLVVLTDEGSASASEIVAGAIQDLDRGLIVGETSFGKGLVQRPYELPDGSVYRLTISRYYTPSGRSIQRSYKDPKKYRALEGRIEAEEGDNTEHKEKIDSTRPVFKTLSGRKVYGGGGIVPDYIVKSDTVTKLYIDLASKVFREFCDGLLSTEGEKLRKQYAKEFPAFLSGYEVSENTLVALKAFAQKKGVQWNEEQFKTDERFVKNYLKAHIARALWNSNEQKAVEMLVDKQTQKALQLFPEAKKISRLN